ncbi:MAG: MGH1-like glycoside hydrolase domain-containing protein [Phycisphaerae bacterium]
MMMRLTVRIAILGLVGLGGLSVCSGHIAAAGADLTGGANHAVNIPAKGQATRCVRIGPFYPEAPNGIAFIVDHKAAFLLRVGWIQNGHLEDGYHTFVADMKGYGPSAAGGWYNRLAWRAGTTRLRLRWSRTGSSIIGQLTSSKPIRIALETSPSWSVFPARYSVTRHGIQGAGMRDGKVAARWRMITASAPAAEIGASRHSALATNVQNGTSSTARTGTYGALVFDLKPGTSVYFAAGISGLENLKDAQSIITNARRRYDASRVAAGGTWGNFLKPINRDLNFARVYGPATNITGYLAMRGWTLPAAQMVFEWDSFFAALQGSIAHPYRSRQTIHLEFAGQRRDGMLQNYFGNGAGTPNRAEPPIAALCVWRLYQRDPDIGFLRRIYPQLVRWHNWWFSINPATGLPFRDANKDGLLEYRNGPESGMDDSPMYDNARLDPQTQTLELVDVGLNSLWAADAGYLARIAQTLGKPMAAAHYLDQKEMMIRRINHRLWNPKAGMYENRFFRPQAADLPIPCRAYSLADGKPGIQGQYYRGTDFNHLLLTRVDQAVDFNWFSFPPAPAFGGQMSLSPMSVRWRGFLTPRETGDYRLVLNVTYPFVLHDPPGYLPSVAGTRLWVDGKLLINHWKVKPVTRYVSSAMHLLAGHRYGIKLEYRRQSGGAMVQLRWRRVGEPKRIFSTQISPTNFYPMIIGAPSKAMAAKMLALLQNRHTFWGRYVVPSIPRDNPTFQQQSYWRGKIWPATNYLLFQGLKRYASASLLNRFAAKSVKLFMRNWRAAHTWNENYFFTGQGSGVPHTTWGPLLCLIGLENICDIRPDGKIALNGTLSEKINIRNIPIGGSLYNVRVTPGHAELIHSGHVVMRAKGIIAVQALPLRIPHP